MKLTGTGVGAIVAIAGAVSLGIWLLPKLKAFVASGKLNPANRDNIVYQATGEVGLTVADIFKSPQEKAVDAMLATVPTAKRTITPVDLPASFYSGSYYDLGVKPLPVDDSRAIGASGVLTSGAYRDQVR